MSGDAGIGIIFGLMLFALAFGMYLLPSFIAWQRAHHQLAPIVIINLVFGWTFIGWIGALIWAVSAVPRRG